jgi:hypothetical protein
MQLSLGFIEKKDESETEVPPPWERLDETARQIAAAQLACLIARMLVGVCSSGEANDD